MTIAPVMPGRKMSINVDRDLTLISNGGATYNLLVANPNAPFKTVPELVDHAKKNPGKLTFASGGSGTTQHLCGELFKLLAGVDMLHVPYQGGAPAVLDLISGRVDVMFGNMPDFLSQIRGGKLRPIAFGGTMPSPLFPDLPLIRTTLPEFKVSNSWFGVTGPGKLSPEWVAYWNRAIADVARQPKFIQTMINNGIEILAGTPDDFRTTIASDRKIWGDVIQRVGLKVE
jgi:tripartite-type tricarboxylate transporter receptor subunit TctC